MIDLVILLLLITVVGLAVGVSPWFLVLLILVALLLSNRGRWVR